MDAERQATHSAECWRWHLGCAVARAVRLERELAILCDEDQRKMLEVERLRAALESLDVAGKRLAIEGPEDWHVGVLCAAYGYGAVMDAAYRLWRRVDPVGALLVGPCVAVARAALEGR